MSKVIGRYVPDTTRAALEATGLDWSLEHGTNHVKVRIAGHLALILPRGSNTIAADADLRNVKNGVGQIRRLAAKLGAAPLPAPEPPRPASPRARHAAPITRLHPDPPAETQARTPSRRVEPFLWRPNMPNPPLRREAGWIGEFTREDAPGALPAGTRVVKVAGELGEIIPLGARGTVLGSVTHPTKPTRLYFVEWDCKPRAAAAVMARKLDAVAE